MQLWRAGRGRRAWSRQRGRANGGWRWRCSLLFLWICLSKSGYKNGRGGNPSFLFTVFSFCRQPALCVTVHRGQLSDDWVTVWLQVVFQQGSTKLSVEKDKTSVVSDVGISFTDPRTQTTYFSTDFENHEFHLPKGVKVLSVKKASTERVCMTSTGEKTSHWLIIYLFHNRVAKKYPPLMTKTCTGQENKQRFKNSMLWWEPKKKRKNLNKKVFYIFKSSTVILYQLLDHKQCNIRPEY